MHYLASLVCISLLSLNPKSHAFALTLDLRYIHNLLKYEFDLQFDVPVTYPVSMD